MQKGRVGRYMVGLHLVLTQLVITDGVQDLSCINPEAPRQV
jgi:hypothetical protein